MDDRPVIAHLDAVWSSTADLLSGLDGREWDLPTECPGWTVRDQLSHVIGTESFLLGLPEPPAVDPDTAGHVRNPLGLLNEAWVAQRRDRPGSEVLAEFCSVTAERLTALSAMTEEEWAAETDSPLGRTPYEQFMAVRVMDCWVHEQDMRRALGRPGHLDGPAAEAALDRITSGFGVVVGKRSKPPDGTTVAIRLEGPMVRHLAVQMVDGRARPVAPPAAEGETVVGLTMTAETYMCLSCGRWSSADVVARGTVRISGDEALAERILAAMPIMP